MENDEKRLTFEEWKKLDNAFKEADDSDNPFVMVNDEEIAVVGDANKTEMNKRDYTITCRFPMTVKGNVEEGANYRENGSYFFYDYEFKDVYLSPRRDLSVVNAITKIYPYFKDLKENGDIDNLTDEKVLELILNFDFEIVNAMYDIVGAFLGVTDEFLNYVLPSSIFITLCNLIYDFPEAFNEADIFFGLSTENR